MLRTQAMRLTALKETHVAARVLQDRAKQSAASTSNAHSFHAAVAKFILRVEIATHVQSP